MLQYRKRPDRSQMFKEILEVRPMGTVSERSHGWRAYEGIKAQVNRQYYRTG